MKTLLLALPLLLLSACGGVQAPEESPCDATECDLGFHCEEVEVVCVTEPCDFDPVAECVADVEPTCDDTNCAEGSVCAIVQVQCVQAPCPPLPQCIVPTDYERCYTYRCGPNQECRTVLGEDMCVDIVDDGLSCQNARCAPGFHCVDENNSVNCVPNECSDIDCANGQRCVENSETGAQCVTTCQVVRCGAGTECVETDDGAQCIETEPTCASVDCEEGSVCAMVQVQCVQAPCPPLPQCIVPNDHERCFTYRCGPNQECRTVLGEDMCVDIVEPTITCANVRCGFDTVCIETEDGPQCVERDDSMVE